jgi:hypothetical protein
MQQVPQRTCFFCAYQHRKESKMINLVDVFQEIHTWQYLLIVDPISPDGCCYAQSLLQLCPAFTTNFFLEITEFDQEDRQRIQQFLKERNLCYTVERFLRPCDD